MAGHEVIKTCGCGRSYGRKSWRALPFVGRQHTPKDDYGPAETIEMRNCPCGSTLAVEVEGHP
jgi:hypothetical protein